MKPQRDGLWAMEPGRFATYIESLRSCSVSTIVPASGSAKDAARVGLPLEVEGGVAIVSIDGVMVRDTDAFSDLLGEQSTVAIRAALRAAASDAEVHSILLRISSPGGSVIGLDELGEEIAATAKLKPVVSQVHGMAASAALYAAVFGSPIYAGRMDQVGSIGTIYPMYDYHRAAEQAGIEAIPIVNKSSKDFKATGMPGTEVTQEQREYVQGIVDFYFADFAATVRKGRKMSEKQFAAVANGQMFPAPVALGLGLIDGIQGIDLTIAQMMKGAVQVGRSRQARAKARWMESRFSF